MCASQSDRLIFGLIVVLIGSTAAPAGLLAAERVRDWKTGKVLDSAVDKSTYTTGSTTSGSINGTVSPDYGAGSTLHATTTANTRVRNVTVKTNTLVIVGDDYAYTIDDETQRTDSLRAGSLLGAALANRKHGCASSLARTSNMRKKRTACTSLTPMGKSAGSIFCGRKSCIEGEQTSRRPATSSMDL
jgi:multidrug efflux pump subunit AcrA (membrane-fusion protein)